MDEDSSGDDSPPTWNRGPLHLVHDGRDWHSDSSPVTSIEMTPDATQVGEGSFRFTYLSSLSFLRDSKVTLIKPFAFADTLINSLVGLPPGLREIGFNAFSETDLEDLRGLPYSTKVNPFTFTGNYNKYFEKLHIKASSLGFSSVNEWVQDRRQVPARRYAICASVLVANKQLEEALKKKEDVAEVESALASLTISADTAAFLREHAPSPVTPLLARIARLPDVLVREIIQFAHGDHVRHTISLAWLRYIVSTLPTETPATSELLNPFRSLLLYDFTIEVLTTPDDDYITLASALRDWIEDQQDGDSPHLLETGFNGPRGKDHMNTAMLAIQVRNHICMCIAKQRRRDLGLAAELESYRHEGGAIRDLRKATVLRHRNEIVSSLFGRRRGAAIGLSALRSIMSKLRPSSPPSSDMLDALEGLMKYEFSKKLIETPDAQGVTFASAMRELREGQHDRDTLALAEEVMQHVTACLAEREGHEEALGFSLG
jgi:hypothetical protein